MFSIKTVFLLFVINCTLLSAFVGSSINCNNVHGMNYMKFAFILEIPGMRPMYFFLSITRRFISSYTVSDTVSLREVRNQNRALKLKGKKSIQFTLWIESLAVRMYLCAWASHCLPLITLTVLGI